MWSQELRNGNETIVINIYKDSNQNFRFLGLKHPCFDWEHGDLRAFPFRMYINQLTTGVYGGGERGVGYSVHESTHYVQLYTALGDWVMQWGSGVWDTGPLLPQNRPQSSRVCAADRARVLLILKTGPYITGASRDNSVTTKLFTTNTKGGHAFFSGSAIDACAFQKGISRVVKLLTLGFWWAIAPFRSYDLFC